MNYDDWKFQAPDEGEPFEERKSKCEGCGEPEDDLFTLGIKAHGLNKESKVCSVCLNMIHEEFTVNLTE